jgi:acetylornithine/succinyldiaminopimelate/putrescine aminotransferase
MSDPNVKFDGTPSGLRRCGIDGEAMIDATAGRASALGFGNEAIIEAIQSSSQDYLGDANRFGETGIVQEPELVGALYVTADAVVLCSSADAAVELVIHCVRSCKPEAFRTVAMIGSDHGRTAACRTASGRPELHEGYGPMMAGFSHVPAGDIDALRATVDDQTACVLLSPIDLHDAARQLDGDYLQAVRELCDEREMSLVMDESKLCVGGAGSPFHFASVADIQVDGVILSAGLFAGLAGGLFIAPQRLFRDSEPNAVHLPLQAAVATATLQEMEKSDLLDQSRELSQELAVRLAEQVSGFEFVRDLHVAGQTMGIETDISAGEIVAAASKQGLLIEAAGDTAVRMQLPLVVSQEDCDALISRLGSAFQHVEHESIDAIENPQ